MKLTDLNCAVIGNNPVVRVVTDEGIDGFGEVESSKHYLKPHVMFYKNHILGEDPTNVEWVMMKIRRLGSFKPWGSAVSAIEMALWDIAGKAAEVRLGMHQRDRPVLDGQQQIHQHRGFYLPRFYYFSSKEAWLIADNFHIVIDKVNFVINTVKTNL